MSFSGSNPRAPRHSSSSLSARTATASTTKLVVNPPRPRPRTTIESNSSSNIQGATGVNFTSQESIASNTSSPPSASPSSSTSASPSAAAAASGGARPAWSNTFAASQAVPLPAVPRFAVKENTIPVSSKDRVKRAVPVSGNSPIPNSVGSQIPPAIPRSMSSGSHSARSSKSIGIASTTSASLASSAATSMQSPLSSSMNPYAPTGLSSNGPKSLVQLLASKSKDNTPTFVSLSANSTVAAAVAQIGALPSSAFPSSSSSTNNLSNSTSLLSPPPSSSGSSHLRSSPSHSRLPHAEKKSSSFASHGTPTKRPHPSATAAAMLAADSPSIPAGGAAIEESLNLALPIGKALTLSHRGQSPNKSGLLPPTLSQKTIQVLGTTPQQSNQLPRFQSANNSDPLSSSPPSQPQLQHRPSQPSPGVTRDMSRKRLSALHASPSSSQYQESKSLDDSESSADVKPSLIGNGSNGPIRAVNNTHGGSLHRKKKVQAVPMLPLSRANDLMHRHSSEDNETPPEQQPLSQQYFHRSQPLPLPPVNAHASIRKDSLTSNSDLLSVNSNPASLSNNSSLLGDDEEENLVQQTLSNPNDIDGMDGYSLVENSLSGVAEIQGSFENSEEGVANVSDSFENHIELPSSAANHARVVSKVAEEEDADAKYEQQMAQLQIQPHEEAPRAATPTHPHNVIPFADATPPGTSSPPTSLNGVSHTTPRTTAPAPSSLSLPRARLASMARPFTPLAAPVISPPATPLLNNGGGAADARRTGSPTRPVSHQTDKALISDNGAQILQLDSPEHSHQNLKLHRSPSTAVPAELSARGEDEVSLMYDPILKCYYEPSTNTYYQLNPFANA